MLKWIFYIVFALLGTVILNLGFPELSTRQYIALNWAIVFWCLAIKFFDIDDKEQHNS